MAESHAGTPHWCGDRVAERRHALRLFDPYPGSALARLVESLWYARGTAPYTRERIAPTGSTVAVFVLGDAILQTPSNGEGPTLRAERGFLIGPHDRPTVNEPTGETFAVGIVTTPIGCQALFGFTRSSMRGQAADLERAWAPAVEIGSTLRRIAADAGIGSSAGGFAGAPSTYGPRSRGLTTRPSSAGSTRPI